MARGELRSERVALDAVMRGRARWETEPDAGDRQGFSWQAVRTRVRGTLPRGFSYVVVSELLPKPTFLDAWAQWSPGKGFRVRIGNFRPFVSPEMLTPLERIPFTRRATAVERIGPRWDLGIGIGGQGGVFRWDLGVFEGTVLKSREALPAISARVGLDFTGERRSIQVDLAGLATEDRQEQWAGTTFSGRRVQGVLSLGWREGPFRFDGELHAAFFAPLVARDDFPVGGHVTTRLTPTKYGELALRLEGWSRTFTPGLEYELVFGGTLWPFPDEDPPVSMLLNYRAPMHRRRSGDHAIELALQLWL